LLSAITSKPANVIFATRCYA